MTRISGPFNSGAAVGANGVATANASSPIRLNGKLLGVHIKYNDAPPAATTDVTIKVAAATPNPEMTLLTISDAATDGWFYPAVQACDTAGAAIAGAYLPLIVDGFVNVKIDQANAGDNVDVLLLMED